MSGGRLATIVALVLIAALAEAQRPPAPAGPATIRVGRGANELVAAPDAAVAYATLEGIVHDVARADAAPPSAAQVVRASPPETIDYVLAVTRGGTLVVGERVRTFDAAWGREVFRRGEVARSYPALVEGGAWRWLVEIWVGRGAPVVLELRAPARWPVERVTLRVVTSP
jgi:hypothetical protein